MKGNAKLKIRVIWG